MTGFTVLVFLAETGRAQAPLSDPDLPVRRNAIVRVYEQAAAAVVNISSIRVDPNRPYRIFASPFGSDSGTVVPRSKSTGILVGSGVVVDGQGHVLTNDHVVADADQVTVTLVDKRQFLATVVGSDPLTDLAVLKIQTEPPLPFIKPAQSSDLMIGETVVTIGNPYGLSHTLTTGVIAALNRTIEFEDKAYLGFIQTDAAIHPGNSGGPLLNIRGELIGINTLIRGGADRIGFAIPIDTVKRVMGDLLADGRKSEVWLGMRVEDLSVSLQKFMLDKGLATGVVVAGLYRDSPAEAADIQAGDLVTQLGAVRIDNVDGYAHATLGFSPNEPVPVHRVRRGQAAIVSVIAQSMGRRSAKRLSRQLFGFDVRMRDGLVTISNIYPKTNATKIGLFKGDRLLMMGGLRIYTLDTFYQAVVHHQHRTEIRLVVRRGERAFQIGLPLALQAN